MATDQVLRNNGQAVRCLDQHAVISAPVMAASAISSYFARIEVRMSGSRRKLDNGVIPQRATGAGPGPLIARRNGNGTLAPANPTFNATTPNQESGEHMEHYPVMGDSRIYDIDFHRLVACVDPYVASFDGVRPFYPPGTLAGVWEGRFAVRSILQASYQNLIPIRTFST